MGKLLDELYLEWLYSQVAAGIDKSTVRPTTYWRLLKQLFDKEFVWVVPNDDNRLEDGRDLRYEFIEDQGIQDVDPHWVRLGCSMLELLVGLARRLSFVAEGEPAGWFWHLIANLGLTKYTDRARLNEERIDELLDMVIFRTYRSNGWGGIFPLQDPQEDQRQVELWYQLSAYVLERD